MLLKVSKTTSPHKLFAYDCVTLYNTYILYCNFKEESAIILLLSNVEGQFWIAGGNFLGCVMSPKATEKRAQQAYWIKFLLLLNL